MSLYSLLTNNIIVNNVLIALKLDAKKELPAGHWKAFKYDPSRSQQQNAGFSHTSEVEESLRKVKDKLINTLKEKINKGDTVLDVGCGPGIYMNMLKENYQVAGVDVSENMIQAAAASLPGSKFYKGNFMSIAFEEKFNAIYSISVLEYVPVSQLQDFFKKCADLLHNGGIIFIQYPNALRKLDLYHPDRNYISYSPALVSKMASKFFTVVENKQSFDGRDTCVYDAQPYATPTKTFKNGYLLIAVKK